MNYINNKDLKSIIESALKEDIGQRDITTNKIVPLNKSVNAVLLAKQDLVICGLGVAGLVFRTLDKGVRFRPKYCDGDSVRRNSVIAKIQGRARCILTAERVALNFLTLLSGISTATRSFVNAVKPYRCRILDTRKTIPGLRILEKYAVRTGGGFNHRHSLDEMVLVKDNHLKIAGGYQGLRSLGKIDKKYQVELEVGNLKEFMQALNLKPDIIMLDNMSIKDMKKAVKIRNKSQIQNPKSQIKIEASGGITLKNVKQIASSGVDMISVGALTHSLKSADISLEIL